MTFLRHFLGLWITLCGAGINALWRAARGKNSHRERAEWLHRWCAFLLKRLSIELLPIGNMPQKGLVVSNHLSYLDILVFAALAPCAFVAKKEVRRWPVFGLLAAIGGTVFVNRSKPGLAAQSVTEMKQTLDAGVRLLLFPEGTSTGGDTVLPFKPALFESAIDTGQPITAARLKYELDSADASQVICYWGEMTFVPHLLRLMREKKVRAFVIFDDAGQVFSDRKSAALALHSRVTALGGTAMEVPRV